MIFGTNRSPDEIRSFLIGKDKKTVPYGYKISTGWDFDFLIFLSLSDFRLNYPVLKQIGPTIIVCDSIDRLSTTNLPMLRLDIGIENQAGLLHNLKIIDDTIDNLIKKATKGSLLNGLMTYIYTIPKKSTQKSVKSVCVNWLFNQHLNVTSVLNSVKIDSKVRSDIVTLLQSKPVSPYREAFKRLLKSNTVTIAKEFKVDIYELNYCLAVYKDLLKNENRNT